MVFNTHFHPVAIVEVQPVIHILQTDSGSGICRLLAGLRRELLVQESNLPLSDVADVIKKLEEHPIGAAFAGNHDDLQLAVVLEIMLEEVFHNGLHPNFGGGDGVHLLWNVAVVEKLVIIEEAHQVQVLLGDFQLLFQGDDGIGFDDVPVQQAQVGGGFRHGGARRRIRSRVL